MLDAQFAHVRVAAVGDAGRMGEFQVDAKPRQQIHGMRHAFLHFNAQAIPPLLEFIGEEAPNIPYDEYRRKGIV